MKGEELEIYFCLFPDKGASQRRDGYTKPLKWDTPKSPLLERCLVRSKPRSCWNSAYFLSASFSEVHGTFRVMWPSPSVDLRLAVCMSELMSAISNTPSCWAIDTRSPRFGVIMLVPVFIWSSVNGSCANCLPPGKVYAAILTLLRPE